MAVITVPSPDVQLALYEEYALALGKVAHAWNMLFERLGRLFTVVSQMHPPAAVAVWNAPDSDRTKADMLKATSFHLSNERWLVDFPHAQNDIHWLLERVRDLTDLRNNVIHAPCLLVLTGDGATIQANVMSGHTRAQKLSGKDVIVEFDYCEEWSDLLSSYAEDVREALLYRPDSPWPDRPAKPNRLNRKTRQQRLQQDLPILPKFPLQSSLEISPG